jgi:hypothetical protein
LDDLRDRWHDRYLEVRLSSASKTQEKQAILTPPETKVLAQDQETNKGPGQATVRRIPAPGNRTRNETTKAITLVIAQG